MKKLLISLLLLSAGCPLLWSSSSADTSEKEELVQIIQELKSLNDEQLVIIQNSQKRNEELLTLSENKQKTIDEQKQTIDELQSLSKEQKKSSIKTLLISILAALASFFIGVGVGGIFI